MDYSNITIEYSFSSDVEEYDSFYDYVKTVEAKVYCREDIDDPKRNPVIGKIKFKIFLLDKAIGDQFDIYEILDQELENIHTAGLYYDFEHVSFKEVITKSFGVHHLEDLCIIESMYIEPEYRGIGIDAELFRDIVINFKNGVALFVVDLDISTFEITCGENITVDKVALSINPVSDTAAINELFNHFLSWGLQKVNGIDTCLFFSTNVPNEHFFIS